MIAPLGSQKTRPGPDGRVDREQFQLLAQHAVVAPLGLFHLLQVVVQFLLAEEGRGVEPLQLLPRGVALPIRAGHRQQLERADRARAGHVRAAAEIDELALPIERHRAVVGQPSFDVLDFERLLRVATDLQGLLARFFDPLERLVCLDDLLHLGLDLGKVFLRQRLRPARNRNRSRPRRSGRTPICTPLNSRITARAITCGTRVPHDRQGLGVLLGEQPQLDFALSGQLAVEAHKGLVDLGRDGRLGQPRADLGGDIARSDRFVVLLNASVGQMYL